jgi:hypothetical protein
MDATDATRRECGRTDGKLGLVTSGGSAVTALREK